MEVHLIAIGASKQGPAVQLAAQSVTPAIDWVPVRFSAGIQQIHYPGCRLVPCGSTAQESLCKGHDDP
jgi:hypothetical protein